MGNAVSYLDCIGPTEGHRATVYINAMFWKVGGANTELLKDRDAQKYAYEMLKEGAPMEVKRGGFFIPYEEIEIIYIVTSPMGYLVCYGADADFETTFRTFKRDNKHPVLVLHLDTTLRPLNFLYSKANEVIQDAPRPDGPMPARITKSFPRHLQRAAAEFSIVRIPELLSITTTSPDAETIELANGTKKRGIPLYGDDHTGSISLNNKTLREFIEELAGYTGDDNSLSKLFREVGDTLKEVVDLDEINHLCDHYLYVY